MLVSGRESLSFMEWNATNDDGIGGTLKVALGKTTGLRVILSQENLTRMVQRSLVRLTGSDPNELRVEKVTPKATDHGGVDVELQITGLREQKSNRDRRRKKLVPHRKGGCCSPLVYPVGDLTFRDHAKHLFRELGEDLENNLD